MVVANNFVVGFLHGIAQPLVFLMLCKISDFSALWRKSETLWAHDTITGVHTGESHLSHRHCGAKVHCDDSSLSWMKQKIFKISLYHFLSSLAFLALWNSYIYGVPIFCLQRLICFWYHYAEAGFLKDGEWRQPHDDRSCQEQPVEFFQTVERVHEGELTTKISAQSKPFLLAVHQLFLVDKTRTPCH